MTLNLPPAESIQIILPIISILFLLLTFKNPIYGAISYFIILNAKLGDMYPMLGAIRFELLAAIIVLISIMANGKGLQNLQTKMSPLNKQIWILAAVGMLSIPQSVDIAHSWEHGGYNLFKLLLFYIMVVTSLQSREDYQKMIWAIVLVSVWIGYEPMVNYLSDSVHVYGYGKVATGRFGAASGHVALANTLSQALPIAFCWALVAKGRVMRLIVWGCVIFLVLGIVFTKSRGGFIGLMACGGCYVIFSKYKFRSAMIAIILFIALIPFAGQQYIERIATIKDGVNASRSSSDRVLGLLNGISMMKKRPILGVGIGSYPRARYIYFRYYFYSHNLYGELLGELGIASLAWFYWVYLMFKRAGYLKRELLSQEDKMYTYVITGVQSGLIVRLVLGNFSHCAFIWFWFMMAALIVGAENLNKDKIKNKELPEPVVAKS